MKFQKIISLSVIVGVFIIAQSAMAADCSWKKGSKSFPAKKICSTYALSLSSNEADCSGSRKPVLNSLEEASYTAVCCCSITIVTPPTPPKFVLPDLQIPIPGLNLTPTSSIKTTLNSDGESYTVEIPWISEYIIGIYNYGLSIAGILAAIILMAGGLLWLVSAGDASKITQAKELITGSVTGLIILMSSYLILFTVNPELTIFRPLIIGNIAHRDLQPDPADTAAFRDKCKPQSSGACATSTMSIFGAKADQASAICNAESSGNAAIYNRLTKCTGGEYAVWGLFQFNLSANKFTDASGKVLDCPSAFGNKAWTNSSPTCTVTNPELYQACVTAAKTPALSISNAYELSGGATTNWGPWEANSKWCNF